MSIAHGTLNNGSSGGVNVMKNAFAALLSATALTAGLALVSGAQHERAASPATMGPSMAVAELNPTAGNQVRGTVTFFQTGDRVTVVADVQGLPPNSTHGFHIHEFGDCSAPDATSAGGHFNPGGHPHAGPGTPTRHAGDLGNVEASGTGRAYKRMVVDNITLGSGPNNIIGRSVIVHAKRDDLTSQPSGDAGARVACGIIGDARFAVKNPQAGR
jgi:Cu-Zn family superoxide dismutase